MVLIEIQQESILTCTKAQRVLLQSDQRRQTGPNPMSNVKIRTRRNFCDSSRYHDNGKGRASSSIKLKIGGSIPPVPLSSASRGPPPPTLLPEAAASAPARLEVDWK
ncbi:hypothetical protein EYF80_052325 [Liparis tanakae]|uniref:Uncharacterized protein n=1 Tax=Liparis tanakae TaxID=230148 RepID=A0A4Z2F8N9_9TELE|nr:hypothetical protein EYF80_052325 [Liparis tanakae]